MKPTIVLFVVILLTGCFEDIRADYFCTPEQMERVRSDTIWEQQHVSSDGTYAYNAAIVRYCKPRSEK